MSEKQLTNQYPTEINKLSLFQMEVLQQGPMTSLTVRSTITSDCTVVVPVNNVQPKACSVSADQLTEPHSNPSSDHINPNQLLDSQDKADTVADTTTTEESPEINIAINNVVCTFSTRCHLNLRTIALNGDNVEHKKAQGMLNMKLRKPSATASIWSSGKITVTGANSEENSKIAARRIARKLQKLGYDVKFSAFRIVNVLGTCSLPFGILLSDFSRQYIGKVQYEPELHPGATYQIKDISATLKIFSTGSITITAPKVENIQLAVENVFPMVYQFKKPKQIDPKELKYIEELMDDSSEAELISDDSDLDLEPGELPSTKSNRFSSYNKAAKRGRGGRSAAVASRGRKALDADAYGSDSDSDDEDVDSDESFD